MMIAIRTVIASTYPQNLYVELNLCFHTYREAHILEMKSAQIYIGLVLICLSIYHVCMHWLHQWSISWKYQSDPLHAEESIEIAIGRAQTRGSGRLTPPNTSENEYTYIYIYISNLLHPFCTLIVCSEPTIPASAEPTPHLKLSLL